MSESDDVILDILLRLSGADRDEYEGAPVPYAFDEDLRRMVNYISLIEDPFRQEFMSLLRGEHRSLLFIYAGRMASRAVRSSKVEFIQEGLKALAIIYRLGDNREAITLTSVLYKSAQRIGLDPKHVFESTSLPFPEYRQLIDELFAQRKRDWSIKAMGFVESEDQDGFRYRFKPF